MVVSINSTSIGLSSKIYVAGHTGLLGSAFMRRLARDGYHHVITRSRSKLDLTDASAVESFFQHKRPEFVVLAAGRVGGITDNKTYPADYITENIAMELNVIRSAHGAGVRRLLFFGSSCMYPRECPQPMKERQILTGKPEPTSISYALAKLAGVQMCLAFNRQYGSTRFLPVIPNSAYGPNDNFDPASSHVLSTLIRKFHLAKLAMAGDVEAIAADEARRGRIPDDILRNLGVERAKDSGLRFMHTQSSVLSTQSCPKVILWGTGKPRRELVYVDDIVDACMFLLHADLDGVDFPVNIGTGEDHSIRRLAEIIACVTGYGGRIEWDTGKPDGAPRKLLDCSRLRTLGWKPKTDLPDGIRTTYQWYLDHADSEQQGGRQ